jgi:hypothetical protein
MYSSEYLHFIKFREADYFVRSSAIGLFIDEWDLESWVELATPDFGGDGRLIDERVISINNHNTSPTTSISIFLDYLDVIISYEWGSAYFIISQDIADTVQRQFRQFQELAI